MPRSGVCGQGSTQILFASAFRCIPFGNNYLNLLSKNIILNAASAFLPAANRVLLRCCLPLLFDLFHLVTISSTGSRTILHRTQLLHFYFESVIVLTMDFQVPARCVLSMKLTTRTEMATTTEINMESRAYWFLFLPRASPMKTAGQGREGMNLIKKLRHHFHFFLLYS